MFSNMRAFYIFAILCLDIGLADFSPIVQLKDGLVKGSVESVPEFGKSVYFYQGIRYGRAVRFEKPIPVEPWTGTYNATQPRSSCPQFTPGIKRTSVSLESEDCLFLNVWVPENINATDNVTVMFWIHGGGYQSGSIFWPMFDGRYIASQGDVIVVSANYRLGPLGFLNVGSYAQAPNNLGLRDSLLALNWVQENIDKFGGNPHQVTLFGESAGSISVGTLILSPLSRNLFHRVIMQSGAPNEHITTENQARSIEKLQKLSQKLNCKSSIKISDLIQCLSTVPLNDLVNATTAGDFEGSESFLPIYGDELLLLAPTKALKAGAFDHKLDLMFGVVNNEGSSFVAMAIPETTSENSNLTLKSTEKDIIKLIQPYGQSNQSINQIVHHYADKFVNRNATQNDLKIAISDAFGDFLMECPTILFAESFGNHNRENGRFYSYRLMQNFSTPMIPSYPWSGVTHGTDLWYLFFISLIKSDVAALKLSSDMIGAWTNFAKGLQPAKLGDTKWDYAFKAGSSRTNFMSLKWDHYKMVDNFYVVKCDQFWKTKIFQ